MCTNRIPFHNNNRLCVRCGFSLRVSLFQDVVHIDRRSEDGAREFVGDEFDRHSETVASFFGDGDLFRAADLCTQEKGLGDANDCEQVGDERGNNLLSRGRRMEDEFFLGEEDCNLQLFLDRGEVWLVGEHGALLSVWAGSIFIVEGDDVLSTRNDSIVYFWVDRTGKSARIQRIIVLLRRRTIMSLYGYVDQIKAHLVEKYGEDPEDPGAPDGVPDGWHTMTINNELFDVRMKSGRVSGIRVHEKIPLR